MQTPSNTSGQGHVHMFLHCVTCLFIGLCSPLSLGLAYGHFMVHVHCYSVRIRVSITGVSQDAPPKRINGPLKKAWRPVQDEKQQMWISRRKPSIGKLAEGVSAEGVSAEE